MSKKIASDSSQDATISWKLLGLYLAPLIALVFDLLVRFSQIREWSSQAWGIYFLCLIISIGIWQWLIFALYFIKKKNKLGAIIFLILLTPGLAFIYLASYRAYFYFKFMPNHFIIEYIFTEPEHFWVIVQEYLPPLISVLILLSALISLLLWLASNDYLKALLRHKWLIAGAIALWIGAVLVNNNNLWRWEQSSLPDANFFLIVGQRYYNILTKGQTGTPSLMPRIVPQLESLNREPEFNILIMVQESLRPDHMSIYGYQRDTTPNLREFFARHPEEVFIFKIATSHSSSTHLSLPTILQGLNPSIPAKYWFTSPLIFEYVKMLNNVRTFFITSQKLRWQNFDVFFQSPALDYLWSRETSGLPHFNDAGVDDRITAQEFRRHITELASKPGYFLGVLQFNANHSPYFTPDEYKNWKGEPIDQYDNSVFFLDSVLETTLNYLEQAELLNNTIIIFTSDHGEAFGEHGHFGHAHFYYENMRVPFWVYIPKSLQVKISGIQDLKDNTQKAVANQDIPPLIFDLYGLYGLEQIAEYRSLMQGDSLLRSINEARAIFSLNRSEIYSYSLSNGLSLVINHKKYIIDENNKVVKEYLFDLIQDPYETNNLWQTLTEQEREFYHKIVQDYPNTRFIYETTVRKMEKSKIH